MQFLSSKCEGYYRIYYEESLFTTNDEPYATEGTNSIM